MEFTTWMDILLVEIPRLWECVKANAFPSDFLTLALGMSAATVKQLPEFLMYFMAGYLLCGLLTIILRFTRNQRSINSLAKQVVNIILTTCCVLMVPMVPLLAKAIVYVLQNEVPPYGGLSDLGRFIADCAGKPFYLYMAIGALIATIWLPLGGAVTYLKRYKLFGLPHAIVDYGTGMYVVSTYLLSSYHGDVRWYWAIAPAVVILRIIQIGGYIPEERNSQAAVVGKTAEK